MRAQGKKKAVSRTVVSVLVAAVVGRAPKRPSPALGPFTATLATILFAASIPVAKSGQTGIVVKVLPHIGRLSLIVVQLLMLLVLRAPGTCRL